MSLTPEQAAATLLMRREARRNLETFAARVPVPGSPTSEADEDAPIPLIETQQAAHHKLVLREMQRCMTTPHGRLMILAPPGSAKSTYASVVAPAWYLGTQPQRRVILASYGDDLARRHGRRTRQLLRSPEATGIFERVKQEGGTTTIACTLDPESRAADEFRLTNGSEYIATGMLGAVTGNRGHGLIIDDPVRGREDADSEVIRNKTFAAYEDDLLTRLIPGGWVVLIQTRWHEDDLAGRILPADWAGQSGDIQCRDGNVWRVVCLQAQCETNTDPLGRQVGDMLWPEWFDAKHWAQFRLNRRTWSSLYQQRPAPADGILFRRDDMATYEKRPNSDGWLIIGGSDYAVTPGGGDWTEHGVAAIDPDGGAYLLDWWRGQVGPEEWIERWIDLVQRWGPVAWFGESGVIRRSTEGTMRKRLNERHARVRMEWLASVTDKVARAQPAIALAGMGRIYYPRAAWVPELQRQQLVFPAGSPDDGVDTLGIIVRGADMLTSKRRSSGSKPYSPPVSQRDFHG
jgi:predicted phage terminase large subunit-like protein